MDRLREGRITREELTPHLEEINQQKLIAWVDAICPYMGDEEIRQIDDPVFPGIDWLSVRPRVRTAPRIIRPGPVD